ncbi:MAG: M3 family oligoendopeptidase [Candidatus Heimdallarchaeaceae archaeon]
MSSEKEITWDLTGMFSSLSDPAIEERVNWLRQKAEEIEKEYKGKINTTMFTAEKILELLKKLEQLSEEMGEYARFASLSFAANMTLPETQKIFNDMREVLSDIEKKLTFVELELGKLLLKNESLIKEPELKEYKHYLEKVRRGAPHKLSEAEEKIVIEKDKYGVSAWSQLQSQWLNTRYFEVEVLGEKKVLSYGEANGLLTHPDRATRESAYRAIYSGLGKDEIVFSTALRNICADWLQTSKIRNYDSPMHQSLIANDVDQEIIDNLMKAIENNVDLYRRYLRLKAKIMGFPILKNWDVVAPISTKEKTYSWEEAKKLVIRAYSAFDEEYATATKEMFEKNHIDASPRYGKRNGAFCAGWFKGKGSFILQTFTNSLSNIYTLAHELGHATHNYYTFKNQSILNTRAPMVTAETASIFGELLMTDMLLKETEDKELKKGIIARVLDGAGMAIFQVSARVFFERALYDAIERGEYLDGETIAKYWVEGRDKIYGDAMEWFDDMKWEWAMKPHYFMANFRFYNYPYVFAQLFVYSLYQKYLEEGRDFIPKFKQILSAGGSKSPKEIGELMGVDITKPDFWELGMKQYERFIDELEKLVE